MSINPVRGGSPDCDLKNQKYQRKKLLNIKSKRKQNFIKKAHELSQVANLKVAVVIYDAATNAMQEFNSSEDFTVENIIEHQQLNKSLLLDRKQFKTIKRKQFPQKNFIERILTRDFLKGYENMVVRYDNQDDQDNLSECDQTKSVNQILQSNFDQLSQIQEKID